MRTSLRLQALRFRLGGPELTADIGGLGFGPPEKDP